MEVKNIKVEEDVFWELKQIELDTKSKKISDVVKMLIKLYKKEIINEKPI